MAGYEASREEDGNSRDLDTTFGRRTSTIPAASSKAFKYMVTAL